MVPGERERKKILDPYLNIDAFETETLCLFLGGGDFNECIMPLSSA